MEIPEDIKSLNEMLLSQNDYRLNEMKKELLDDENFYFRINVLRNPNEHKVIHETLSSEIILDTVILLHPAKRQSVNSARTTTRHLFNQESVALVLLPLKRPESPTAFPRRYSSTFRTL